jgi:hypothetical protein
MGREGGRVGVCREGWGRVTGARDVYLHSLAHTHSPNKHHTIQQQHDSLTYYHSDAEVDYILTAVHHVADHGCVSHCHFIALASYTSL